LASRPQDQVRLQLAGHHVAGESPFALHLGGVQVDHQPGAAWPLKVVAFTIYVAISGACVTRFLQQIQTLSGNDGQRAVLVTIRKTGKRHLPLALLQGVKDPPS